MLVCMLLLAGCGSEEDPAARPNSGGEPVLNLATLTPLPPLPESPYLNTRDTTYVGSSTCIECHQQEHAGFLHTGMGHSMARVVPQDEPPDVTYDHEPSGRRYQVVRKDGRLVHRELAITAEGEPEVLFAEHEVPYVIGSGRHTRTYVIQVEGFMYESPLTWYSKVGAWEMSPGYDRPGQLGFHREIGQECLVCHAGRTRALEGTVHRMELEELSISCERCHGPGSRHVDRWTGSTVEDGLKEGALDLTIVNPADLDRELSDSICAQCHLGSPAVIPSRGRSLDDYRPGLPLDAFRNGYQLENPGDAMTVVGHVDQLRLSGCYQHSAMSCVTCHDPHNMPAEGAEVQYYNAICMQCHKQEACQVDPVVRQQQRADNYCVHCHMPRSDTELPHMTFHHHRVGLHKGVPGSLAPAGKAAKLVPLFTTVEYSELDMKRNLGIAYIALSQREEGVDHARHYVEQGAAMLRDCWQAGLRDVDLAKNLAEVSLITGTGDAGVFARFVLQQEKATGKQRVSAYLVLATEHLKKQEFAEAVKRMREVTRLRRHADDWEYLGQYELAAGNREEAIKALRKAIEIDPARAQRLQVPE
jgi:predicted CXXCH cytochrome family protein